MPQTLTYRYACPSSASSDGIALAPTIVERPARYFTGYVERPDIAAAALLAIARVARTRYFIEATELRRLLDPVLTSEPAGLHVESFSGCCGVHARLHLLHAALDAEHQSFGTVSVDFNEPMRAALARIRAHSPLHLQVGFDAVELNTIEGSEIERRVPLPERWVRGFAEIAVAAAQLPLALDLGPREAQRFIRSLPRGRAGKANLWAKRSPGGIRLSPRPDHESVWLSSPERLRSLEPLTRHVQSLRVYARPAEAGSSVWVADLGNARVLLTLSPDRLRGFSGEGGLLYDLADRSGGIDAAILQQALKDRWRFGDHEIAASGLSPQRARRALTWLGATGQIGFDPTTSQWFRRPLPFPAGPLHTEPPRLRDARGLAERGAVRLGTDSRAEVTSGKASYEVRLNPPHCTCAWWGKHPGDRGPCKHVLAATLVAAR